MLIKGRNSTRHARLRPRVVLREARKLSLPQEKLEMFKSMEDWATDNLLVYIKPVEKCWQPQEFLPDPTSDGFYDQVEELRQRTKELPDEYLVVLVGDMITEDALPTYQTTLNNHDAIQDETGSSMTPWAVWIRGWTAEENRHGDLLNKYLYLSDIKTENNPHQGFIYASYQERATFISHGNTARHAKQYGDTLLAQICGTIAADKKRHETAYVKVMQKIFEVDPDESVISFAQMMQKKISMPAHHMYDGEDDDLFVHFSNVTQRLGVYTAKDYADILEFLVEKWGVEKLVGLSDEGRKAQDYVCGLGAKIRKLEERAELSAKKQPFMPFSWIFDRQV
ncbi:hypothetical protein LOK49_LG08G01993 [Camellia lanceoleosa]|uniref:Uncharacterized protein n=1 Tax=Camellia lanceoleosa TaxID=1840588 RepID=A0ACC0GRZ2_9ERIC|nr:hypothetical protein LOK49_LG08G01993 [Camellia lanceoleosa]